MELLQNDRTVPIYAPVTIGADAGSGWTERLRTAAVESSEILGGTTEALDWARLVGATAPLPGEGRTARLWELLATIASVDLEVARTVEPHIDALAILAQLPESPPLAMVGADALSTWGVFASEGGPSRVFAQRSDSGWLLTGTKAWCSLATIVSHALVTAHTGETTRRLFAVDLDTAQVQTDFGPWHARGLQRVVSAPVHFDRAHGVPIGPDEWYLERPGFQWGGIGVAACWFGGAVGVARTLHARARRREPDLLAQVPIGMVDRALWSARLALSEAADAVDAHLPAEEMKRIAKRTRGVVAESAERVLGCAAAAMGPEPMTNDPLHAQRVADLQVYLQQHHAGRNDAALGRIFAGTELSPW